MKGGSSVAFSIFAGLALGGICGLANGALVAYGGLSAFVATLATMTAYGGVALLVSSGATVFGLPDPFLWLGQGNLGPLPVSVLFMVVCILLAWVILEQMVFGRACTPLAES